MPEEQARGAVSQLFHSRKFVVLLLSIVALAALAWRGVLPIKDFVTFVTVTVPAWLLAVGAEDAAAKVGKP